MIDSHCHLDDRKYNGRTKGLVAEAARAGIDLLVTIGADLASSKAAVTIAHQFESVYAAVGVHPHDAKTLDDATMERITELAAEDKVVAIGEIGLDYFRNLSPRPAQKKAFEQQLALAVALKLPVVIHTREAFADTVSIVREYAKDLRGGVFHCFPGTADEAQIVFDMGFHISVGGIITYDKSQMAEMVTQVPLERVLLETDAPYLAPEPHRGKINHPAFVTLVCNKLAKLRGISPEEVERVTDRNSRKLFRLGDTFEG
ncbi:MAG: TatD family hydrolase [candidate division Zixibacteria bacterium]|nr:TatD family hydrolase [candidate division Zixibacteria bacterium]